MAGPDKKALNARDICTKFITPALVGSDGATWNVMTQLREECYFTKGRVIVREKTVKRGEAKKVDYLLFYRPNVPIAVIEAKDNNHSVGAGMQQALEYADPWRITCHGPYRASGKTPFSPVATRERDTRRGDRE